MRKQNWQAHNQSLDVRDSVRIDSQVRYNRETIVRLDRGQQIIAQGKGSKKEASK